MEDEIDTTWFLRFEPKKDIKLKKGNTYIIFKDDTIKESIEV